MAAQQQQSIFHVIDVAHLNAERDVFMGLPVESTNKQTFHRVPIRSACMETVDERRVNVQFVHGSKTVVQSCRGLRRLLLKFHSVFVPGVKVYTEGEDNAGGGGQGMARVNLSMGFGLYDNRTGPTPEETQIMKNIDDLSAFIRSNLVTCEKMRTTLKMGPANMKPDQQRLLAETMDLYIIRPLSDSSTGGGNTGNGSAMGRNNNNGEERMRSRYCYVKLVAPEPHIPEVFHSYFWTPDGKSIPLKTIIEWRNFTATPYVEVEDVFVNKAMRSVQLKLRECVIIPPTERPSMRFSVCFPDRVCSTAKKTIDEKEEETCETLTQLPKRFRDEDHINDEEPRTKHRNKVIDKEEEEEVEDGEGEKESLSQVSA